MKRIIAVLLAAAMIMTLSVAALAAEGDTATHDPVVITKEYTVSGGDGETIPTEELSFKIEADGNNPADVPITIDPVNTGDTLEISIAFGTYSVMGVYKYVVTENAGDTLGVTYDETPIEVIVTVVNETAGTGNTNTLKAYVGVYELNEDETLGKKITGDNLNGDATFDAAFTNEYAMGQLTVSKKVEGNLAKNDKAFDIVVTFTGGAKAGSPVTYTVGDTEKTVELAGKDSVEVPISLKNGESVVFNNIPAGVSYTVVEDEKHTTGDLNSDEGYTATYKNSDNDNTESGSGAIAAEDKDTVEITNEKSTEVQTGVFLETLPYVVIGLVVVAAAVAFVIIRKRRNSED